MVGECSAARFVAASDSRLRSILTRLNSYRSLPFAMSSLTRLGSLSLLLPREAETGGCGTEK